MPIYLIYLIFFNASVLPDIRTRFLGRYYNSCNSIYNHYSMRQSDLALEKYWMTQSGYFRHATIVVLGMCITYGELLFYNVILKASVEKNVSTR